MPWLTLVAMADFPTKFSAGETIKYTGASFSKYPADDGWTAKLWLAGADTMDPVAGVADGAAFDFTIAATATDELIPGNYAWHIIVEKSGEKYVADHGTVEVLRNIARATAGDMQSWEEKQLTIIDDVLNNRFTSDVQTYTIAGRAVTKIPISELLRIRSELKAAVDAQRGANAGKFGREVRARFPGLAAET